MTKRMCANVPRCLAAIAAFVGFNGCGGGNPAGPSQVEQSQSFGPVTTRFVGQLQQPVVASSTNSVVTGLAGAKFNALISNQTQPRIAFTRNVNQGGGTF